MSNPIYIQPVPGSEFLEKHSFPKFHQQDEQIPKIRILPNDTLLVGIDFANVEYDAKDFISKIIKEA